MVYRRKLKGKDGAIKELPTWWVKYYVNGPPVRESTGTHKEQEATRFLQAREGRVAMGQRILRRADRKLTGTFSGTSAPGCATERGGREGGFDSYPVECAGRMCPESLVLAAATGS